MRRRSLRMVVGLAVATALLGGCSAKHEASDTLPSAAETSAAPSLESLGPADFPMPDEARTQDAAGAEAAARYYLSLTTYAFDSLNTQPLRDLSRNCEFCTSLADTIETDAAAGHTFIGGEVAIGGNAQVVRDATSAEVYAPVSQSALRVLEISGNEVRAQPAYDVSASVLLEWSSITSSWIVTQVTVS